MRTQIPVVELLRVSTADQGKDDRAGIPRQIEINKQTIARHNLHVVKSFKLIDVSGTSIMHTPELMEMLNIIRAGQVRGIVIADFDRLMRPDDFRSLAILQDIKETQTLLYLPEQVIDLNTQSGFLMSGLQSVIAGNELAQIKKRMMGAKEEKRRQGKCPSFKLTLPLGVSYDREKEKFYYNKNATKVKELFHLFHDKKIHNFNELDRLTGIQYVTVRNLLQNELFIGYRHYTEKRAPEKRYKPDGRRADRAKMKRLPHEVIRVKVIDPPLIDEETFWSIQQIIKNKKNEFTHRRIKGKKTFLFSGYLKCAVCGKPMYTVPRTAKNKKYDYYYCRSKSYNFRKRGNPKCPSSYLRKEIVEEKVLEFISERLSDPDYIIQQFNSLYDEQATESIHTQRKELQKKISELKKKKSKVLDLYLKGLYSEQEISEKAQEIQEQIEQATEQLGQLKEASEELHPEDYRDSVEKISEAFCEFPFWGGEEQRSFLSILKPSFNIGPDGITQFSIPVCKNGNRTHAAF
jgi:DNA invertase Pin-like site-specific DNA recombinase